MDVIFRGSTVFFSALFYDTAAVVIQPDGALVKLTFPNLLGVETTVSVTLASDALGTPWTGSWDSRVAAPGAVWWSLHSTGSVPPFAVRDGRFTLTANAANVAF